jgi:hypothetical protein
MSAARRAGCNVKQQKIAVAWETKSAGHQGGLKAGVELLVD